MAAPKTAMTVYIYQLEYNIVNISVNICGIMLRLKQ